MVNGELTKLKDARLRQTEMVNKYSYKYIFRKQNVCFCVYIISCFLKLMTGKK